MAAGQNLPHPPMSERASTKGRGWNVVDKICVGGLGPCVDDQNGAQIACIGPYVANGAEKANLIAAAPDMFEALKDALFWLEGALQCDEWDWSADQGALASNALERGRSALSKAEGRTNLADATPSNPLSEGRERS